MRAPLQGEANRGDTTLSALYTLMTDFMGHHLQYTWALLVLSSRCELFCCVSSHRHLVVVQLTSEHTGRRRNVC